jgi:hypothetical protein
VAGMAGGDFTTTADDSADALVYELCHDLIGSAAAVRVLALLAEAETDGADPAAAGRVRSRLRGIAGAAGQIVQICEGVLEQRGTSH